MLPQMKLEMLNYDSNFEDLRRLFKEVDKDASNYLTRDEFSEALTRLGVALSDGQLDELIKEVDLDAN